MIRLQLTLIFIAVFFSGHSQDANLGDTVFAEKLIVLSRKVLQDRPDSSRYYLSKAADIYLSVLQSGQLLPLRMGRRYLSCREPLYSYYENQALKDSLRLYLEKDKALLVQCGQYEGWNAALISYYSGIALDGQGKPDEAISEYRIALDRFSSLEPPEVYYLMQLNNRIAESFFYFGKYDSTLKYARKSLSFKKVVTWDERLQQCVSFGLLGKAYSRIGSYDSSITCFRKALNILEMQDGDVVQSLVSTRISLGIAYGRKGDFVHSRVCFLDALKLYIDSEQRNMNLEALIYSNLGSTEHSMGHYDEALSYFTKSVEIRKELQGSTSSLIILYGNIADNWFAKGDIGQALSFANMAVELWNNAGRNPNPVVLDAFQRLISYYLHRKDFIQAHNVFSEGIKLSDNITGENSIVHARFQKYLGMILFAEGKSDSATSVFNHAAHLSMQISGFRTIDRVEIFNRQGESELACGMYQAAINSFMQSIHCNLWDSAVARIINNDLQFKQMSLSLVELITSTMGLARCNARLSFMDVPGSHETLDYLKKALTYFSLSDSLLMVQQRNMIFDSDRFRYAELAYACSEEAIRTSFALSQLDTSLSTLEMAYGFLSRSKARVMLDDIFRISEDSFTGVPDTIRQLEHDLRIALTDVNNRLMDASDSLTNQHLSNKHMELNLKYKSLIRKIETDFPGYFQLIYQPVYARINTLKDNLSGKTVMMDYFVGDSTAFLFLISNEKCGFFELSHASKIDSLVNKTLIAIRTLDNPTYQKCCMELSRILLIPFLNYIKNVENLIIIPSGSLYSFPFETLFTQDLANSNPQEQRPYLIKDYAVSYHLSSSLWLADASGQRTSYPEKLIAFAPVFGDSDNSGYSIQSAIPVSDTNLLPETFRSSEGGQVSFSELKNSALEVHEIVKLFDKKQFEAIGLIGEDASEESFYHFSKSFPIIHVASHSFVSGEEPMLSGIAFSQKNVDPDNPFNDGILYARDIYRFKLNTSLLVLSSCESGKGKLTRTEGMMSLARGFFYSGVKNQIFSLWKVYDRHTASLMKLFYSSMLEGNNYATSLRSAKLSMISSTETSHPLKWSGLVLYGSNEP